MYKIADFNSLWEIGFAIHAIFVYFELHQFLENKFTGIRALGKDIINHHILEKYQYRINTSGWRRLAFGYVIWLGRLKLLSIFNSLVALLLIIIAGYNPEAEFGIFLSAVIIASLFLPLLFITAIILFYFPFYKIKCIEYEINQIIENVDNDEDITESVIQKYKAVIEFIKFEHFPLFYLFMRNKKMPFEEVLRNLSLDDNDG